MSSRSEFASSSGSITAASTTRTDDVRSGADLQAERAEIDSTLAARSVVGVFAYLFLLVVFFAVTPALHLYPAASLTAMAWMSFLGSIRLWIARSFHRVYSSAPRRWSRRFHIAAIVAGASWGAGCALWMHAMGAGAESLIVLVSTAGVAAGAMSSLSPSPRLARGYLLCMLGPTILVMAALGDGSKLSIGFALVLTFYLTFLAVEVRHQYDAFILAIRRTILLQRGAEQLGERSRAMKLVLDTIGDGFLSVALDGTMGDERSAILARWLGAVHADDKVWDYLGRVAPEAGAWLQLGFDALLAGELPIELILSQLPQRFRAAEHFLAIEYRPVHEGARIASVLMILSDVTSMVERDQSERDRRELLSVFDHVLRDRNGVLEFITETDHQVQQIAYDVTAPSIDIRRGIHTLKGNAALFGLDGLAQACHELETTLDETALPISQAQRDQLASQWRATSERIARLLGNHSACIQLAPSDVESLTSAIARAAPSAELAALVAGWALEPVEVRLLRIAQQARGMARRLDKGEIDVVVEANALRLPAKQWSGFWGAFVHVVRNAVDHGLETPQVRRAVGKRETGTLIVRTFVDQDDLVVSLEDDGRGIDWAQVAASARASGLASETRADLEAVLFADGVTTRSEPTEFSGRGLGMGAVLTEVRNLGGKVTVWSEPGRGTRCTVRFPARPRFHLGGLVI